MTEEIKINKNNMSITFINNGIAFSQFGVAPEILDYITDLQQENEKLNNIINELEKYLEEHSKLDYESNATIIHEQMACLFVLNKLKELKGNKS